MDFLDSFEEVIYDTEKDIVVSPSQATVPQRRLNSKEKKSHQSKKMKNTLENGRKIGQSSKKSYAEVLKLSPVRACEVKNEDFQMKLVPTGLKKEHMVFRSSHYFSLCLIGNKSQPLVINYFDNIQCRLMRYKLRTFVMF